MMQLSVYKEHYKETIRLGVPIMLGQLGIIVVGFADNIMVGHHSTAELAAASFVNNFFNLVFIAGMGFSYGLTPIIGGYFAQKEYAKAGETLKNSLCINLIVGLLLSLCMLILLLNIHILKQPEELMPYIVPYYILQLFSVIFAMLFNSFKQFSDGTTDTVTPMCVMLGANVLNIIGNYLLIYGNFGCPELGDILRPVCQAFPLQTLQGRVQERDSQPGEHRQPGPPRPAGRLPDGSRDRLV